MQQHSNESNDVSGRICLITGATSGIGLATAHELAERGATVMLVGRNETKTRSVVEDIRQQTGNTGVDYLLADLSSQAAVRGVADAFRRRYGALHVLINNAGVFLWHRRKTVDGLEMTLAVNYLAPFLLTTLLLDTLRASAPARVVTVASDAHRSARIALRRPATDTWALCRDSCLRPDEARHDYVHVRACAAALRQRCHRECAPSRLRRHKSLPQQQRALY